MRKLKVYGGLISQSDGKQHRMVIAVSSKAELARILGVGMYIINNWWSETGNKKEIEEALKNPGTFVDMGAI